MKKHFETVLIYFLTIFLTDYHCHGQIVRSFPPLKNLAKSKKIITTPSDATCGSGQREAFCMSSTIQESITTCRQEFCSQACPFRSASVKDRIDLLKASGFDVCVSSNYLSKLIRKFLAHGFKI